MTMTEGHVDWLTAIVVGFAVGWMAERLMHTDVHPVVNIATSIAGALLMNLVLDWVGLRMGGWYGYAVKGFVGSCILLAPLLVYRRKTRPPKRSDECL